MYLVRKISRAKWDRTAQLTAGEIPADAVTADLRTQDNALSWWGCAAAPGEPLDDAILALVAGAERVDKVDVVWIERADFVIDGVALEATPGRTPVSDLSERHVDATRLDFVRLGGIARRVVGALAADHYKRLTKKRVAKLLAAAVEAGRVTLDGLDATVRAAVEPLVTKPPGD